MQQKIRIFSVFHKNYFTYRSEMIIPLQVGKPITNISLDMLSDDNGCNISEKNKNFCELTALYWIWKNIDADYVGLCHYRRYFLAPNLKRIPRKTIRYLRFFLCKLSSLFKNHTQLALSSTFYVSKNNLSEELKKFERFFHSNCTKFDIILPKKIRFLNLNVKQQYSLSHIKEDLYFLENLIIKKYPSYSEAFYKIMNSNRLSAYNMFIMKKPILDDYCEWLFDILFTLEEEIVISKYPYQQRVFGFIAERLLNVYIEYLQNKSNLKIKYLDIGFVK